MFLFDLIAFLHISVKIEKLPRITQMVLNYKEAITQFGNAYKLSQAVSGGLVFKLEDGIYSTNKQEPELGIIMKKYPKAVLAGEYAFYAHGLTNLIPEKYDLATTSKAAKLTDKRVRQIYVREDIFNLGIEEKEKNGSSRKVWE